MWMKVRNVPFILDGMNEWNFKVSKNDSIMSQSIPTGYIPPGQPPVIRSKKLPEGSGFDFWKLPGGREFDKGRDFVESSNYA